MKKQYYFIFLLLFSVTGCFYTGYYIPQESDKYLVKEKEIIFESNALKLQVNCGFARPTKNKQTTIVHITLLSQYKDLQADFGKIELHTSNINTKSYLFSLVGSGGSSEEKWSLGKGKEYSFSLYVETEDTTLSEPRAYLKNISLDLEGIFQTDKGAINVPEFYFIAEQ